MPAGLVLLLLLAACGRRPRHAARPLPPPTPVWTAPPPAAAQGTPAPGPAPAPGPQMSEPERKASARALYAEGVQLQERGDCEHALPRFEGAERMYDAPTHLLHIAQCQAKTGRLVEARESYATLAHLALTAQAPEAFRKAQKEGRAEASRLTRRIPTLRVKTNPPAASLKNVTVDVNGTQMPVDLLGVARPLNPGRYRVTVNAGPGRSGVTEVELEEGATKSVEVRLSK